MAYSIQLTFSTPTITLFQNENVCRIQCTAHDAVNMPNEVFLFQKATQNTVPVSYADELITVCSPFEISTFPITTPDPEQDPPYFRKASFDILVPMLEDVSTVQTEVRRRVKRLVDALTLLDNLTTTVNFTIT